MMATINFDEAKNNFVDLLQRVIAGEEIVIVKAGKPVARIIPFAQKTARRVPGSAKGQLWLAPDFDAPLSSELLDAFEGKAV